MFTIIIPTHERPLLLRRALQSLIAQTCQDFKVVIVSDSAGYLPPYEEFLALQGRYVYIIRSGVAGPAESRNMGLAVADSRYIIFLDDDDTFEPGHLQALAEHIGSGDPEMLFCDFKVLNEDRRKTPPEKLSVIPLTIGDVTQDSLFILNRIPNCCLVYRRDVVAGIKNESSLRIYEDWDFLLGCLKQHKLAHVPIDSVLIHKSEADGPENLRRGNTRDDLILEVMLYLYEKHPAPNLETRLGRQALLARAGVTRPLELC